MQIRDAVVNEAEAITELINAAFAIEKFFVEGDRIAVDEVRSHFQKGVFLVAEDNGLAGCVYLEPRGERAYFGLLSIDPLRQRSGLGSRLVAAVEDRARQLGCHIMDLRIINLREELPAFYRRLGYAETGTDALPENAPIKLPCHFVNMSKTL